jgi:hypothetical protein
VWPYVPWSIAISADGVIWTAGYLKDDANTAIVSNNLIRRYDRSGKMLGSMNVRAKSIWPRTGPDATQSSYLMPTRDGVGWVTNTGEYIEFALNGMELTRFDSPPALAAEGDGLAGPRMCGAALGEGGDVLVCVARREKQNASPTQQVWALDRQARAWKAAFSDDGPFTLAGFDGDAPITLHLTAFMRRYRRNTTPDEGQSR